MLIGKPGAAKTAIAAASADRVSVRGRDLAGDLMGRTTFTEFFFLAATGRAPNEDQRFFLDLSLVAIAEHGLTPSVQAARMTYAADPAALQGAVAAGVLGCGTVILGAADLCRKLIDDVLARAEVIGSVEEAALTVAREHREMRKSIAGFGHPLHKPVDPRAERMIALARERRVAGRAVEAAVALTKAVAEVWGKPLPMNVSMAIAATLRDVDVPPALIRAVPILARTAGLIAHLIEEAETPIGFYLASKGEEAIDHARRREDGPALMPMVEPEIESAPWEEQARADAPLYLSQIEYLFDRSRFYRGKLERAGFATHGAVGGLEAIHALPLTEKDELRASRTPDEPIGTHLTAAPGEIARIYSTSGTTGTPSYIPLDRGRCRRLGPHLGAILRRLGDREGRTHRLDLQCGAVRRRRGAWRVRSARALPHPRRNRKHRTADDGRRAPQAHRRRDDAVLRAAPRRMGAPARHESRAIEREAGDGRG